MKWLQWSNSDLAHGLGGVETHARCVAAELTKLGVETGFSRNPKDLQDSTWDIIQTHGSGVNIHQTPHWLLKAKKNRPIWIHTLHGTTIGRMIACREWSWPGGYLAYTRELKCVALCDILFVEQPLLHLYKLARLAKKPAVVCSNGWDPWNAMTGGESELTEKLHELMKEPYWVYVGRGGDVVKAVHRVTKAIHYAPQIRLLAIPGEGFEENKNIHLTGPMTASQIHELLKNSNGLVLCSRYEGYPMAVLEALGLGVPVVTTNVGGIQTLSSNLEGLYRTDGDPKSLAGALLDANQLPKEKQGERATANRKYLMQWSDVAKICLESVNDYNRSHGT